MIVRLLTRKAMAAKLGIKLRVFNGLIASLDLKPAAIADDVEIYKSASYKQAEKLFKNNIRLLGGVVPDVWKQKERP